MPQRRMLFARGTGWVEWWAIVLGLSQATKDLPQYGLSPLEVFSKLLIFGVGNLSPKLRNRGLKCPHQYLLLIWS